MSDRLKALTAVLEDNFRSDDAEPLIEAIRLLRGVIKVTAHVADLDHYCAVATAKNELRTKITHVLRQD